MKKSILNLRGVQALSQKEQKTINGGKRVCVLSLPNYGCGSNECCSGGICYRIGTLGHLCEIYPV